MLIVVTDSMVLPEVLPASNYYKSINTKSLERSTAGSMSDTTTTGGILDRSGNLTVARRMQHFICPGKFNAAAFLFYLMDE